MNECFTDPIFEISELKEKEQLRWGCGRGKRRS